jgi:hypothetical protein
MTVVFVDLSSFTEMTGRLGATTTYSVVDEFLRFASTTLMSHGAFIDKYRPRRLRQISARLCEAHLADRLAEVEVR